MALRPHQHLTATLSMLVAAILIASSHPVAGQDNNDIFFATEAFPYNISWSADSQQIAFFNLGEPRSPSGVVTTLPNWGVFDLGTQAVRWSTEWPFQPTLTASEVEALIPSDFIYVSPNEQLLLFSQRPAPDQALFFALANRSQPTPLTTDRFDPIGAITPELVQVVWSADSTGLAVSGTNFWGEVFVDYFNIPDANDLSTVTRYEFNPMIDGLEYVTFESPWDHLYDISDDGERVLLTARPFDLSGLLPYQPISLIVWPPQTPDDIQVFDTYDGRQIRAAAFAPHDETKVILVIEGQGVVLYDLLTRQSVGVPLDLAPEIDPHEHIQRYLDYEVALFSPNGEWLLVRGNSGLLIIDIASRIA